MLRCITHIDIQAMWWWVMWHYPP